MKYRVLTNTYGSTPDKIIWSDTQCLQAIGSIITREFNPVGYTSRISQVSYVTLDKRVAENIPKDAYVQDGIIFLTTKHPMRAIDWMLGIEHDVPV